MTLELMLFSTRPELIVPAVEGGVAGVVVDWERIGKAMRQRDADTHIAADTFEDLVRVRACTEARVICRVDGPGPWTAAEITRAIGAGADEVLLPMVRRVEDVHAALDVANERAGVGILIETQEALEIVSDLAALPLSRIYVGLTDLAIERGTPSIFTAVADGTVERLRRAIEDIPFGFGGMTVPEGGSPVPARLLLRELLRLGAEFTFLRRSFWRDVEGRDPAEAVRSILVAAESAAAEPA